jgi:signal transduction histidine kinase
MKFLKILILADMVFLMILGFGMFLYIQARPAGDPGSLWGLGMAAAGSAAVVLGMIALALMGDYRRFAMWLSYATGLVTALAFIQQQVAWGSVWGWILVLTCLLMTAGLAWAAQRPLKPGEKEAELALRIPKEIRQDVLRQISEAAAQEERNRLARDLHDSIKQQLFSINVGAATAQERWERDPEGARAALADVRRSAKEAMVEMQALLHQLRPQALASSAGLVEALREQCEALGYRTGAEVTLELGDTLPDGRLPPGAQETLFRIAQEALGNVARHARARKVRVWLGREGESALLRVEDDGQGFDPAEETSGMGLRNLRERAESAHGTVEVASQPGSGTTVGVRIPLTPAPKKWSPVEKALAEESSRFWFGLAAVLFWLNRPILRDDYLFGLIYGVLLALSALASPAEARRRIESLKSSTDTSPGDLFRVQYKIQRNCVLDLLAASWWAPWYWRLDQKVWGGVWAVGWILAALWFAVSTVRALPRLHGVSEPRTWPLRLGLSPSIWSWLVPLLAFAAMALLVLTFPPVSPRVRIFFPSPLTPSEVLLLVFGAAILIYVLSRQPRREGAAA